MRKQRAFKDLTELEIDQIANWLRTDTYETVLERIRKPRPDGFGLTISRKPLELLHAKKNTVDKINQKIATGEKLSIAQLDDIVNGDRRDLSDDLHNAILETAYELVTSEENTPTRLLALQRLADFPERAELRIAKEERQCEQHSWKSEMHTHRLAMHAHRKHIAEERLNLAQKSFDLRERLASHPDRNCNRNLDPNQLPSLPPGHYIDENGRECDHLGPLPKDMNDGDAISARARKKFGIKDHQTPQTPSLSELLSQTSSESLSNLPDRADATSVAASLEGAPPPKASDATPAARNNADNAGDPLDLHHQTQKEFSSVFPTPTNHRGIQPSINPGELVSSQNEKNSETPTFPSLPSLPPVSRISTGREAPGSKCQMKNAQYSMPNESVVSHAIRRWRAYQPRRYQDPEPTTSWTDECPCGVKIPCDKHGLLWNSVRYMTPSDPKYAAHLKEAGIPHYIPTTDELTRAESTDMPCTSVFYTKRPAHPFVDSAP